MSSIPNSTNYSSWSGSTQQDYGPAPGSISTFSGTNTSYVPSSSLVFQNSDPNPTNTFSSYGSTSSKTHIPSNFTYSFPANTPAVLARPYQTPSSYFGEISAFNFSKTPSGSAPKISELAGSNAWKVPSKLSIDFRPPVEPQISYMQRCGNESIGKTPWLVTSITDQKAQFTIGDRTSALSFLPYEPSIGNHKLSPYKYGQAENLNAKTHDTAMDQFYRSYVSKNPDMTVTTCFPAPFSRRMQEEQLYTNFLDQQLLKVLQREMEQTFVNPQKDYFVSKQYDLRALRNTLADSLRSALALDPNSKSAMLKETASKASASAESSLVTVGSPSFSSQARKFGSHLTHKVFDELADLTSDVPKLLQDMYNLAEHILYAPKADEQLPQESGPLALFEDEVASGHQIIDKVFGTNQAAFYTPENKELRASTDPLAYSVLPPPGRLVGGRAVLAEGRLAATQVNSTWGWKVGDPINNKTWWGGTPKWSTVRARHWKNQAEWAKCTPDHEYGNNIPRMKQGFAPQQFNPKTGLVESMELHHIPPQRDGGLFDFVEVWPLEHTKIDPNRYLGH